MGLYDRSYMNNDQRHRANARGMLFTLIIINIFMFSASRSLRLDYSGHFEVNNLFQLVTAGFAHDGFGHIFFNMWGLYIFGSLVAPHLDNWKFLMLYLAGTVIGNTIFLLFNLNTPVILLGASGAVCAVMAAAAVLEPNRRFVMFLLPFGPIKTTTLVICYTALDMFYLVMGNNGNIAHLAHLGGFIGGYLLMKIFFGNRLAWDPLRFRSTPRGPRVPRPEYTAPPPHPSSAGTNGKVSQHELDILLDKLSREGINSLSEYELERLRKARRQMRGEE